MTSDIAVAPFRKSDCRSCKEQKNYNHFFTQIMTESPTKKPKISEASKKPRVIICAVDIEAAGPRPEYPIIAIGARVGYADGTVIASRKFCQSIPREKFEKKCWDDFWVNNMKSLEIIEKESAKTSKLGIIREFYKFLFDIEQVHGPFGRKHRDEVIFRLVSDNPVYDIGSINDEFIKCGIDRKMAEMFSDYVPTDDPSEQIACLTPSQLKFVKSFVKTEHTHDPEDDAAGIYELWCGVHYFLENRVIKQTEFGEIVSISFENK